MDSENLINLVLNDSSLSSQHKKELSEEHAKNKLDKLLSGAGGAGLMLAVSKYKNMSKPTQVLLGAIGFGIGEIVYNFYHRKKFANYNEEAGTYEIDTTRY